MSTKQQLVNEILSLQDQITATRARERQINKIEASVSLGYSQPAVKRNALEDHLTSILPAELIPSNVGDINQVQWGFFYQIDFDFGNNPTFNSNTREARQFKVTNESAFLLTRLYRDTDDAGVAGLEAPLTIIIKDLQSSRQFMSTGIPVQCIPGKGFFYELPVPFLLYPAASAELEIKCWLPEGVEIETTGTGTQHFTLYGARVRVQDPNAILKAMFQKHNG